MAGMKIKTRNRFIGYSVVFVIAFALAKSSSELGAIVLPIGLLVVIAVVAFEIITEVD
jgi:hypothetical protein